MRVSFFRGHQIEYKRTNWIYSDTRELVKEIHKNRPCGYCNLFPTKDGHDRCLGMLPGIMNACCGHGDINESYVQFLDGSCIRGKRVQIILKILKKIIEFEGGEY